MAVGSVGCGAAPLAAQQLIGPALILAPEWVRSGTLNSCYLSHPLVTRHQFAACDRFELTAANPIQWQRAPRFGKV
jgi:hypothetical protein